MDLRQRLVSLSALIVVCFTAGTYGQLKLPSYSMSDYPLGKVYANPNQQFHFAALCLKNQSSSCTNLDQHGSLNVTDGANYCGLCSNQTKVVLNCIDKVKVSHFLFTNKASTNDIRESIDTGCATGNFTIVPSYKSMGTNVAVTVWTILLGVWLATWL